ncbi:MAG: ABC transporter ATP-binding protein [Acholeplasmataceae bacterium]|nr:ABC transporter ATP-binding protein [Acholeplasmataceae bacterium]
MALLEVKDLVIDYGIIRAVKGINIHVDEGKIVAILGANGAGKSSLIRSISGGTRVKSGSILFESENITNKDPHVIAQKGILQSPEGRLLFYGLTVEENLRVGAYALKPEIITDTIDGQEYKKKISVQKQVNQLLKEVYQYFPILGERRKQQASTLSGGEQQMLAIGRALMGKPKLLLLDEPSLGLAPLIVRDIFNIVTEIKKRGTTVLIVEQNAYQTLKIADYGYLMELGLVKKEGTGQALLEDEELIHAYLGSKK